MSELISALLQSSAKLDGLASQTNNVRIAGPLISVRLNMLGLVQQLRTGVLQVPAGEIKTCLKELQDVDKAAAQADGSKDDNLLSRVIVEGQEALTVIYARAVSPVAAMQPQMDAWGWRPVPPGGGGPVPVPPFPFPYPFPMPGPWPPRPWPFPPRPWPPEPFPWDWDLLAGGHWDPLAGYRRR